MGKLYLVPTPIGNLKDITLRAIDILKSSDLILCEDTRVSSRLLKEYDISVPLKSYHQANEHRILDQTTELIANSNSVSLITDAGTPGISDPGFLLIRECLKEGIEIECLPGPTAIIPALVLSGLPSDRFYFEGFLPHKKGRQSRIKYISQIPETVILYESPHRIGKCLGQLIEFCGPDRMVSVSRELTKMYEETLRGSLEQVMKELTSKPTKGEFVIVLDGKKD